MHNYGYEKEALRICGRYLDVVTLNFIDPKPLLRGNNPNKKGSKGFLYEKYDVVTGGINDWEYPAWEFLGWSAGVLFGALIITEKMKIKYIPI